MVRRNTLGAAVCICTAILAACTEDVGSDTTGTELMAQAKAASGGNAWERIEVWHETGRATASDSSMIRYEHWHDAQSLSTRNVRTDASGGMHYMLLNERESLQSGDAAFHNRTPIDLRMARSGAYFAAFGFFFPSRFPVSFHYEGQRSEDVSFDVVNVSPQGLEGADVWLDLHTHRVCRIVSDESRWREDLSDYREVNGVLVPFTSVGDGMTFTIDTLRFEPRGSVSFSP